MTKRRARVGGMTAKRWGSRQTKVHTARRESVWDGVFQESKPMRRVWPMKMIPHLQACQISKLLIVMWVKNVLPCVESTKVISH